MSEPACNFGKCIISPLYDQKVTLQEEIDELTQSLSAGTIAAENQAATMASIEEKQRDIERLNIEIGMNLGKVCDICPYRMAEPISLSSGSPSPIRQTPGNEPAGNTPGEPGAGLPAQSQDKKPD